MDLSDVIISSPSLLVFSDFLFSAPLIVKTAGLFVIAVEPSALVLTNLIVYFPE